MRIVLFQTLFLGGYVLVVVAIRCWARDHALRRAEEERERRAAREREWRVGIPYDPGKPQE